jgi:surface polysaccharide O-acyltransferase-like enzyme
VDKFKLNFFCGFSPYYLTGWYLVHIGVSRKMKYGIYIAAIISVIITFVTVQLTGDCDNGYSNLNIFTFLYSVGVFYALVSRKMDLGQRKEDIIKMLSKLTFGIYMVHPIVRTLLLWVIPLTNPLLCIISVFILTLGITFVICYIASKNAITRKLIRM